MSARARLRFAEAQHAARRFDQVLHHGKVRPEVILLENHANILTQLADGGVGRRLAEVEMVAGDFQAARAWLLQQVKHAQE